MEGIASTNDRMRIEQADGFGHRSIQHHDAKRRIRGEVVDPRRREHIARDADGVAVVGNAIAVAIADGFQLTFIWHAIRLAVRRRADEKLAKVESTVAVAVRGRFAFVRHSIAVAVAAGSAGQVALIRNAVDVAVVLVKLAIVQDAIGVAVAVGNLTAIQIGRASCRERV